MSKRRDQLIAVFAATIVVALIASVVTAVMSAERNGRQALEDLQLAQLQQLARVLDGAFTPALTSPVGIANPLTRKPWTLTKADASDRAGLDALQNSQPTARTGYVLVDKDSVVVNGTLLTNPGVIGQRLDTAMHQHAAGLDAAPPRQRLEVVLRLDHFMRFELLAERRECVF